MVRFVKLSNLLVSIRRFVLVHSCGYVLDAVSQLSGHDVSFHDVIVYMLVEAGLTKHSCRSANGAP